MWGLFVAIGGFIAGLFQGGIDAVVTALVWAVGALQAGALALWNGLKAAVDLTRRGFIKSWDLLGDLYDDVLKPAWDKFWSWFDKLRTWLNNTFGPVLTWLQKLRAELLKFWNTYVRPWLDLIDVTRKLLNVLASLGLDWARALDQRLTAIEEAIEKPFLFIIAQLNGIINVVNSVVGKDGLLQRVALVRSLARDYQYAWRAIAAPYTRDVTDDDRQDAATSLDVKTLPQIETEIRQYIAGDGGDKAALLDEMTIIWRQQLGGQ